jgi:6-pyruvoyltetrahydropterin/6-carboxytetrahydropterin synthase
VEVNAETRHRIFVGKDVHKFSCAHMTVFPSGKKERLHGHNFQVEVALDLKGVAFQQFIDFALVKAAIQAQCDAWTERLLLAGRNPHYQSVRRDQHEVEFTLCAKRYVIPADEVLVLDVENIVVESLAVSFAAQLLDRLAACVELDAVTAIEVTVSESPRQGGVAWLAVPARS